MYNLLEAGQELPLSLSPLFVFYPMRRSHHIYRKHSRLPSVPLGTVEPSHTYRVWRLTSSRLIHRNLLGYFLGAATASLAALTFFGEMLSVAVTEDTKVVKHPSWKNPTAKKQKTAQKSKPRATGRPRI